MAEIDVDLQDEVVREFVRALPTDPDGTWLRVGGKPLFRVIPVSDTGESRDDEWTDEQNARRCLLIEKDVAGTITPEEAIELEDLQARLRRHRRLVAPLPLAETQQILEELEQKATRSDL